MTDLKDIKAFAFDIDGVMTDGGILADLEGQLYRTFDAKDGFAVRMANMNGYPVAVITGARSQSVRARFSGNGIPPEDIYLGSRDKITDFDEVVALDKQYIENWSLWLDLKILVKTVKVVLRHEGAS